MKLTYKYRFYPTPEQAQMLARTFGCVRYVYNFGRTVVKIGRFEPTSKRCSNCEHQVKELPLSVRAWTCERCGTRHDRDVNAALNILAAGQAVIARGGQGKTESHLRAVFSTDL